jgi:hypothetical protein
VWGEKGGRVHYKGLCTLEKHEVVCLKGPKSILVQMTQLVGEKNQKVVQMKALFHVLA